MIIRQVKGVEPVACKKTYIEKYGRHFNEKLLAFAIDHMCTVDVFGNKGKLTPITKEQVERLIKEYDIKINNYYEYDCIFIVNMAVSDFYGSSIEDERHLILYAKDLLDDPDGYEGLVFNRWVTDIMAKEVNIDWTKFM